MTKWIRKRVGEPDIESERGQKKCEDGAREMHMSVWISICLWRAASGRVYQSFPIIYIQQLISLHRDWEWVRVGSFA